MAQVFNRLIDDVSRLFDASVNKQQAGQQRPQSHAPRYFSPKKLTAITINEQNSNDLPTPSAQANLQRV
ncbi:unnamed protein product [Rotaria sp. Silwood2]|nr:unnamed protein product [Rotaria sp. Silwood2]CAF3421654.1 unnamed protein product [Rotaria sp. Silwood2]CAF4315379.1 unnamed protein product [Rotaria sp. Silwood2]CAF4597323.1 unnamed protein product [Rotaria sp. Silwood2]